MVHVPSMYSEKSTIVQCSFGDVWCIHDQEYSKEKQQTRATQINVVTSNKKAVLVNKILLKATLFWVEKEKKRIV